MKYYLGLFCCALFLPLIAHADVKINEVAWMGTAASQYSEWIELYNDGGQPVSLDGWKLYKTGSTLLFTLTKTIPAGGYIVVERTTASAPDAIAGTNDESGTFGGGGLRNTGEDVALTDADGTVMDSVSAASGWPAGDAKTKETMQWNGSKWITATGTPDAKNATNEVVANTTSNASSEQQTTTVTNEQPTTTTATTQTPATTPVTVPPIVSVSTLPSTSPAVTGTVTVPSTAPIVAPAITTSAPFPEQIVVPPTATKTTAKSNSQKKAFTATLPTTGDTGAADTLEDPAAADDSKENNHTKIFIFGAVILIGMALFLLLQRFKAQQE